MAAIRDCDARMACLVVSTRNEDAGQTLAATLGNREILKLEAKAVDQGLEKTLASGRPTLVRIAADRAQAKIIRSFQSSKARNTDSAVALPSPIRPPLAAHVEHVPQRLQGADVAHLLTRFHRRIEEFRAPEVTDLGALALLSAATSR
jgi:hypothetical protein